MKKAAVIWMIVATSLVLLGSILFTGVMFMLEWDFLKLSTTKYVTNEYTVAEDFKDIKISGGVEDITFLPAEDEKIKVVCYEEEKGKHKVEVVDGSLVIEKVSTKRWFEHIGINFGSPKITVYLPSGEYGDLYVKLSTGDLSLSPEHSFESVDVTATTGDVRCPSSASGALRIKLSTGDITINNISADSLELTVSTGEINVCQAKIAKDVNVKVSTGKTRLEGLTCRNFTSDGSTGSLTMQDVIATEKYDIERSTGSVTLETCDASEIFIKTDTGDVSGSLLTEKVFITETDTGSIKVPNSISGGRCEITTDTGDINITVG